MEQASTASGQVLLVKDRKAKRQITWPDVAHEVAEYFMYEPRVPSLNTDGGSRTEPFGRAHQFSGGRGYYFMRSVFDRLREADRFMPYICTRKKEQPSSSMVLRAAYGAQAAKYDDSAPKGEKFLKAAQDAYVKAANIVGRRTPPNRMEQVLRRFDLVFSGVMTSFPTDEDD